MTASLKERFALLEEEEARLEKAKLDLYRESIEAPEEEKIAADVVSRMIVEDTPLLKRGSGFPWEVTDIDWLDSDPPFEKGRGTFFVKIRPVSGEGAGKTYLGIHLGSIALGLGLTFNRESGVLHAKPSSHNPAIWVPDLQRIIFGVESWWGRLKSPEDLRDITDADIDSVWYVQALKALGPLSERG